MLDNPDQNMKNEKFCSQLSTCFKRHMAFMSKRTVRLCSGQMERPEPQKRISKIGLSWMKETLDSSLCQKKKFLQ
jgi:hypothetical protein